MNALKAMDSGLTEAQIYELMRSCDVNGDSKIDFEEFAGRFQVVFERVAAKEEGGAQAVKPLDDWAKESFSRIGAALYAKFDGHLTGAFEEFDSNSDKQVDMEEFCNGVKSLELDPPFS